MKNRIFACLLYMAAVSGCRQSPLAVPSRQYQILKSSGASPDRLCRQSELLTKLAFEAGDEEGFTKWEQQRKHDCKPVRTSYPAQPALSPTGQITGHLSFPSERIPKDMQVCARNVATRVTTCSRVGSGPDYTLRLPPATYIVWAKTKRIPDRAFYSKAVVCGLSIECTDHRPIKVDVEQDQTRRDVDPGDWYVTG